MNRNSDFTGGARHRQEVRLAVIIDRFVQLRRRMAILEGNDPDAEVVPLPENIAGLQRFVNDTHPGARICVLNFGANLKATLTPFASGWTAWSKSPPPSVARLSP
jgi:hypothetical protein